MEKKYSTKVGLCFICGEWLLWNIRINILFIPQSTNMEDPSEMAEVLCNQCERALSDKFRFCFLPYEREILKELAELIYKYFKDGSLLKGEEDGDYLVYQNKSWIEVRELALKTIKIFGYDLDDFNYD